MIRCGERFVGRARTHARTHIHTHTPIGYYDAGEEEEADAASVSSLPLLQSSEGSQHPSGVAGRRAASADALVSGQIRLNSAIVHARGPARLMQAGERGGG